MFAGEVSSAFTATIRQLQEASTFISQQLQVIKVLQTTHQTMVSANSLQDSEHGSPLGAWTRVVSANSRYSTHSEDAASFLELLGDFFSNRIKQVEAAATETSSIDIGTILLNLFIALDRVVAERIFKK